MVKLKFQLFINKTNTK